MHVFTSITANYLPKASALAHSVKRVHPEAVFHVVLCDEMPECSAATTAPFDSIINVRDLPIENLRSWIFKHRLVELCTAVKGTAFQYIAARHGAERIYYFDPDILVLNRLDGLERMLDQHSILLTPHLCVPETDIQAVLDNEHCCLMHGVYNLGFLAVKMTGQGRQFIDWWAERLRSFCYDEVENGLFTDQRWVDLAPAFFDDIAIVREPQYNVATWNLTHRRATGARTLRDRDQRQTARFLPFFRFRQRRAKGHARSLRISQPGSLRAARLVHRALRRAGSIQRWVKSIASTTHFPMASAITASQRLFYRRRDDLMRAISRPI